jgi:multiple sugar transport system substrate-binding protein
MHSPSRFCAPVFASALALSLTLTLPFPALAGHLVINADQSDTASRKVWGEVVEQFRHDNPDIDVSFNVFAREAYKTQLRQWLTSAAPDVVFWYAGERMHYFVQRQLLEDVSSLWTQELKRDMANSLSAVSVDGKQYGIPYSYYHWGIFYRKDLFEKAGITNPPKTWPQFLEAGKKLRAQGITPVALGSKALWPAAGWFDYLNLRLHGIDFHRQLMAGKIAWTDARVHATFDQWGQLLKGGFFLENHAAYDWQEAQPFLFQGKAAMELMGNFASTSFPPDLADKIGFFPFPEIDAKVPRAEEAPLDSIHIPQKAQNKKDARRFLQYVAQAQVQEKLNAVLLQIPAHARAKVADNRFLQAGQSMLAGAHGLSQFFDRDTDSDMAQFGMKAFAEFLAHPERLDAILKSLEAKRLASFK